MGGVMSRVGKMLIGAIKEAKEKGLVTLQSSPDVLKRDFHRSIIYSKRLGYRCSSILSQLKN